MNTFSDTDEGRPRPSVWPVYLAAAVIGLLSLRSVCNILGVGPPPPFPLLSFATGYAGVLVLLGLVTLGGLIRLRRWGWWCAVVWTTIFAVPPLAWSIIATVLGPPAPLRPVYFTVWLLGIRFSVMWTLRSYVSLGPIVFLVWAIATRRRLLFPPKVERTDEGRPRPSAWPICVMCVIIFLLSLLVLSWAWFVPRVVLLPEDEAYHELSPAAREFAFFMQGLSPFTWKLLTLYGLLGILAAAVGAPPFRPWGWWCVVVWVAGFMVWHLLLFIRIGVSEVSPIAMLVITGVCALFVWLLLTRRRLFFPERRPL